MANPSGFRDAVISICKVENASDGDLSGFTDGESVLCLREEKLQILGMLNWHGLHVLVLGPEGSTQIVPVTEEQIQNSTHTVLMKGGRIHLLEREYGDALEAPDYNFQESGASITL